MKLNSFILSIVLLLLVIPSISAFSSSNVSIYQCYQETANATNSADGGCKQSYNGAYAFTVLGGWFTPNLIIDGNFATGGYYTNAGDTQYLYINYTKPQNSTNLSIWTVRDGDGYANLSITNCWTADSSKVILRLLMIGGFSSQWQCFDGSSWNSLRSFINTPAYEEAMNWNINSSFTQETLNFTSSNQNIARYLLVPQNTIITNAFINLTGNAPLSGLEEYWKFDETSGLTAVESISGVNNITLRNSTEFFKGKIGNAIYPNGSELSRTNVTTRGKTAISINFWINQTRNLDFGGTVYNIASVGPCSLGGDIAIEIYQNNFTSCVYDGASSKTNLLFKLNTNAWEMITYLINSTTLQIYRNGTLNTTQPLTSFPFNGGQWNWTFFNNPSGVNGLNATGIDEFMMWNYTLSQNEISLLWNNGNGGLSNTPPINLSIGSNSIVLPITTTNGSASQTVRSSNLYQFINSYISSCSYIAGMCYVPLSFYSANTGILLYSNMTFNNEGYTENSRSYNTNVYSGAYENFSINITYDIYSYSGVTVNLVYNNTNYTMSSSDSGSTRKFTTSLIIPMVSISTAKPFYFNIILQNSSGSTTFSSNSSTQTINPFLVDNCTVFNYTVLNFTMFDQDSLAPMNGTIEALVSLYAQGTTSLVSVYNNSFNYITGKQSAICLSNISSAYTMSYSLRFYGNSSYFKQFKNLQSMTIINSSLPQNVTLYNLQNTNGVSFNMIIVGNSISPTNAGLLVDAQRQYLPQNAFYSVESTVTGQDGTALTHLVPISSVYTFVVSYNGVILATFNNYQVQCQNAVTGQCSITLNLAQASATLPNFNSYGNITGNYQLDRVNNILYFTYSSTDGNQHTISQQVIQANNFANTTICSNTGQGTSGTLTCTITNVYQNTSFYSSLTVDGTYIGSVFFSLGSEPDYYGVELFIELLIYTALVLMMLSSPKLVVVGSVLGLFFSGLLLYLSAGSLSAWVMAISFFAVAAVMMIIQMRRLQ